ncbi:hypothetical protein FA13DRAFT_1466669 [Coprinellus micaceus]|uniref:Uncharacterized protein n=1 Tax=Coprinellus micaceus TaxID=71717 RepID=A0A4Y7SNG7_COPMI|nr:hypothetical protein FA13DRAFT_1466669 [Coprinellus micaceus]
MALEPASNRSPRRVPSLASQATQRRDFERKTIPTYIPPVPRSLRTSAPFPFFAPHLLPASCLPAVPLGPRPLCSTELRRMSGTGANIISPSVQACDAIATGPETPNF